jgi:hypothetical protein
LTLKPPEAVAAVFAAVGADPSKRVLVYCGGGIAATLNSFLLHQRGYRDVAVYDASMFGRRTRRCLSSADDRWCHTQAGDPPPLTEVVRPEVWVRTGGAEAAC